MTKTNNKIKWMGTYWASETDRALVKTRFANSKLFEQIEQFGFEITETEDGNIVCVDVHPDGDDGAWTMAEYMVGLQMEKVSDRLIQKRMNHMLHLMMEAVKREEVW